MDKWADPELWLRGGGIAALLLVGLVLGMAYIGVRCVQWAKPMIERLWQVHVTHVEVATTSAKTTSESVSRLADTVTVFSSGIEDLRQATRHKAEMIHKLAKESGTVDAMAPHLEEIRSILGRRGHD